jgi:LPS-assembly protein
MLLRLVFVLISASFIVFDEAEAKGEDWQCKKNRPTGVLKCASTEKNMIKKYNSSIKMEKSRGFFFDSYSKTEEKVFQQLKLAFDENPWGMCANNEHDVAKFTQNRVLSSKTSTEIYADVLETFDQDVINFLGDVDFLSEEFSALSNYADYNKKVANITLFGDVIYKDAGIAFYSSSTKIELNSNKSLVRDALFVLSPGAKRGSADVIYRESKSLSRLKNPTYTSCPPGNQDWVLHASKMKINDETGRASILNGWLEVKNVPVMYIPYASFPIDDRRKTGLLMPPVNFSGKNGFDFTQPFYWNIAANYDLTIFPRYMSERGLMLGTKFRYLAESYQGKLDFEVLPEDKLAKKESTAPSTRWGVHLQQSAKPIESLNLKLDANYVSDKSYFSDLGDNLDTTSRNRYLASNAETNYNLDWLKLGVHVDNYQNIDPSSDDSSLPYRRLPKVTINMHKAMNDFPVEFKWDNEYVYFKRHITDDKTEGQRLNIKPAVSFPIKSQSGFITPTVALQHTQYWLDGNNSSSHTLSKTLGIVSLDSGLFFERDFGKLKHTLEPRLYYLYVPYVDQSELPNFDTALADFNTGQLFRDNTFNGADKTQNTNQITTALTTRVVDEGRDLLKLTVGEIFYFSDRKVGLTENEHNKELLSNLITEVSSELSDELRLTSSLHYSYQEATIDRGAADIYYHGNENHLINIGYRYRLEREGQEAQEQINSSIMWPIYDSWSAIGAYRHSLRYRMPLEYFFGVEKDTCCLRLRIIAKQSIRNTSSEVVKDNSIFFQFELKGFTNLGTKLDKFLFENIAGYSKPNY